VYTLSPENGLPADLSFDSATGVISGTPKEEQPLINFVVKACTSGGCVLSALAVLVTAAPLASISYAQDSTLPTVSGGVATKFSVEPRPPLGVRFDPLTGNFNGRPFLTTPETTLTVTASNNANSVSTTYVIPAVEIVGDATTAQNLIYLTADALYVVGVTIDANFPVSSPSCSLVISPSLGGGLSFRSVDGYITGTPNITAARRLYTVSCTETSIGKSFGIYITVIPAAPSNLTYPTNPLYLFQQQNVSAIFPHTDGTATSFEITPALAQGLRFNTTTGAIRGRPTGHQSSTLHVVTAINTAGRTSTSLRVIIIPSAPVLFFDPAIDYLALNQPAAPITPKNSGGQDSLLWSISPSLPAGLLFSNSTGERKKFMNVFFFGLVWVGFQTG